MVKYERSSLSGGDGLDDNEVGDSVNHNTHEMEGKDKSPDGAIEFKNSTSYRPPKKPKKGRSTLEKILIGLCIILLIIVIILSLVYAFSKKGESNLGFLLFKDMYSCLVDIAACYGRTASQEGLNRRGGVWVIVHCHVTLVGMFRNIDTYRKVLESACL